MITTREAARRLGCSPQHVRTLIRKGKLRAKQEPLPTGGFYYLVNQHDVVRYAALPPTGGWPRGRSRK